MKKKFVSILTIMLFVILCVTLSACVGETQNKSTLNDGTYYRYEGGQLNKSDYMTLDGLTWTMNNGTASTTISGDLVLSGDSITLHYEAEGEKQSISGTVKDGVLTLTANGTSLVYCKEGKAPSGGTTETPGTTESIDGTYYLYQDGQYDRNNYVTLDGLTWTMGNGTGLTTISGDLVLSGDSITLRYEVDGETQSVSGTVKDGVLTLTANGTSLVYCKEGKAPSGGTTETPGTTESIDGTYYRYEGGQLNKSDYITLNGLTWTMGYNAVVTTISGDLVLSGDSITLRYEAEGEKQSVSGTIKDGVLTLTADGNSLVLCKEGKAPIHNHTISTDDGDCTTAITCTRCNEVMTAAIAHTPSANWSKDDTEHWKECTNENCKKLAVEKTNHAQKDDANACECGNSIDVSIFTIKDGKLSSCIVGAYTSITIPNGVTSIGNEVFKGRSSLASIDIPDSVTSIGDSTFNGCSSLKSIAIPNSVTSIGNYAFAGCSSLASITVAEGNTKYHSAGNSIIEKATNTLIVGCKNSIIPTDDSVTSIGGFAFSGCSTLESIDIPNSVTSIGDYAFSGCSTLASITIGNSVISIGDSTFNKCSSLKSIDIPNSVTSIGSSAFDGCSTLASITIGNSVTSIGDSTFKECSSLTSIAIPNSVTRIGSSAFFGCSSLTNITIGNSVISIGDLAFDGCISLASIVIPNSVTSIGIEAFDGCSSLTSITIPVSVTSIGGYAFFECSSLTNITYDGGTTKQWKEIHKGVTWYSDSDYTVVCIDGELDSDKSI